MLFRRVQFLPHCPKSARALLCLLPLVAGIPVACQIRPSPPFAAPSTATGRQTPPPSNPSVAQELHLGNAYLIGNGVPKDPVQSAYWYRKAADQGDPGAQIEMGYFCLAGTGVDQNPAEAAKWFARAAGSGSSLAKVNLATLYMKGTGVPRDPKFALSLLAQAAERGNAHAAAYLGVLYSGGYGIPRDAALSEKWFAKSAKGKNPEGEFAMANLLAVAPEHEHHFDKAAKLLRHSARAGYVPAMSALGILLLNHPEIPQKTPDEALAMLGRAAEAGRWESSAALAGLARDGRGMRQDLAAAFRWFTIAARQGGDEAEHAIHEDLAKCREALTAERQDRELQAASDWLAQHPDRDLYVLDSGFRVPILGASPILPE